MAQILAFRLRSCFIFSVLRLEVTGYGITAFAKAVLLSCKESLPGIGNG